MVLECEHLIVRCDRCHDYALVDEVDERFMYGKVMYTIDDDNRSLQIEDWHIDGDTHYCPDCVEVLKLGESEEESE